MPARRLIDRERRVLNQIALGAPLADVLEELLRAIEAQNSNAMLTSVLFLSEDGKYLRHGAAPSLPAAYNKAVDGISVGEGVGSCGTAASRRVPVYVSDVATDPLWADFRDLALAHNLRACWSTPIMAADGALLGTFAIYYDSVRAPTDEDIAAIAFHTQTAALAIERHRSDLALNRSRQQLHQINDELKRANQRLAERVAVAEGQQEQAWRNSLDLLVVGTVDGTLDAVNPAWTRLLGWEPEDLVGSTFVPLAHPDDLESVEAVYAGIRDAPLIEPYECRLRHKNGSYRHFAWKASLEGEKIFANGRDVTEERAREAAFRELDDVTQLALTSTGGVGVWNYDVTSDRFACDPALADLYGLDRMRASTGIPFEEAVTNVHPNDLHQLIEAAYRARSQTGVMEHEHRVAHPDGSTRWVLSRGRTYHDPNGSIRRLGIGIDTTRQHSLEDQLRQSQKMEAVGQLTGGLAHDFNNLLTGIMGNLELLQTRISRGRLDELDRFVNAAHGAGRRAALLTQRLLAFSRRQTLDPKPTDANRLIVGLNDLLRRTVGPLTDIEVVQAAGLWHANIDAAQLENAIVNLCLNGRDAMPEGGRLTIETANKWIDDRTGRERDLPAGEYVSISVTDTGTGMTPEVIARAFDPFYTTKPIGQGTGLGLSMIYGFARQSGGQVRIYSDVGEGTTIRIYLPRFIGEIEDADTKERLTAAEISGTQTILVVDDELTIRHLIEEVLDEAGYTVIGAADGAAALKVLQSDARIELMITDVGLPNGMNGRQVADAARTLRSGIKVLFISGFAENAAVGNGQLEPGMELLSKPFSISELTRKIHVILARE